MKDMVFGGQASNTAGQTLEREEAPLQVTKKSRRDRLYGQRLKLLRNSDIMQRQSSNEFLSLQRTHSLPQGPIQKSGLDFQGQSSWVSSSAALDTFLEHELTKTTDIGSSGIVQLLESIRQEKSRHYGYLEQLVASYFETRQHE